MSRIIAVLLVALTLGCRAEERSFETTSKGAAEDNAAAPTAARVATEQRMIIRTASLAIVVADTRKAVEKVTTTAESLGGYVSGSKVWREGELLRASISYRVPADKLNASLAAIRGDAVRVQSESMSSDEVTEEYVDLDARLKTLQATENELKVLMVSVRERSRKASEVLEMHQQLMNIRSESERVQGRMRYLQQMTALATANIDLIPDAIAQPVVEPGWQPVVVAKDAGRALVNALQVVVDAAIWLLIFVAPIMFLISVAILIARRSITLAWRTRKSPSL